MKRRTGSLSSGLTTRIGLIVVPLLLSACAGPNLLEQRLVLAYHCEMNPEGTELTVSGMSSGSALLVKKVKRVRDGQDLIVNVHIGLVGGDQSASFSEKIPVEPDLSRVLFGRDREVVWSRELGGCAPWRWGKILTHDN